MLSSALCLLSLLRVFASAQEDPKYSLGLLVPGFEDILGTTPRDAVQKNNTPSKPLTPQEFDYVPDSGHQGIPGHLNQALQGLLHHLEPGLAEHQTEASTFDVPERNATPASRIPTVNKSIIKLVISDYPLDSKRPENSTADPEGTNSKEGPSDQTTFPPPSNEYKVYDGAGYTAANDSAFSKPVSH